MGGKIVDRGFDGLSGNQGLELGDEQVVVEGFWGVVIEQFAFLVGEVVVPLVVVVVVDDPDLAVESFDEGVGEGGFAGAGATGDTDNEGFHEAMPIN